MEKYRINNFFSRIKEKKKREIGRRRARRVLFFIFFVMIMLLSSCRRKLKKAFSEEQSLQRLSSVSVSEETEHNTESFEEDKETADQALSYRNPFKRMYPASITKLMTALVCVNTVQDLEQEFVISPSSSIKVSGSSTAFLQVGESVKIRDLLYGMLLPSGNDAAVAVAEASAGSVDRFVEKMNEEAVKLGALSSHFTNPHGLPDENHYTSSYDIYLILKAVMENKDLREILSKKEYQVIYKDRNGARKSQVWKATNLYSTGEKVLPEALRITGAKTGTTKDAGYCLALNTEKKDSSISYISVVMKSESKDNLYQNMTNLLAKIS